MPGQINALVGWDEQSIPTGQKAPRSNQDIHQRREIRYAGGVEHRHQLLAFPEDGNGRTQRQYAGFGTPINDVAEYVRFVIRRVADAVVIAIAAGVIAPIIAAAVFGERIGIVAALLGFEGRLPDLVGVADRYTLFVIRLTKII